MVASVLTNSSAMVALQTLRATNSSLNEVNNQISTGKKVAEARDNAAVFAITKVMESDVAGFKAVEETLSLGNATATVANDAAGQLNGLLNEIKGKIISANEDNVDRDALQAELVSLRNQVAGVVGAAQFNGLNLLSNTEQTAGTGTVNVLSSLDRDSSGAVTTSSIDVVKQDLGTGAAAIQGTITDVGANKTVNTTAIADGTTADVADINAAGLVVGTAFRLDLTKFGGTGTVDYVIRDGDTATSASQAIADKANFALAAGGFDLTTGSFSVDGGGTLQFTNNTGAALTALAATDFQSDAAGTGATAHTVGGGLEILSSLDISTDTGAEAALVGIESLINTTINAQASFGTAQKRIELQSDFMSKLIDSFKVGIGALVDADLEEASARLQALQVQQQLGIQSLSIANQAPQNILALFR